MSSIDEHCLSHSARAWYSSARLTLNLRLFRDAAALIRREGSSMIIKHYSDVKPGTYAGTPDGVQVREMITGLDGAPNFSLRVFDVQPGVSTPFHTHEHEHEVFMLVGVKRGAHPRLDIEHSEGEVRRSVEPRNHLANLHAVRGPRIGPGLHVRIMLDNHGGPFAPDQCGSVTEQPQVERQASGRIPCSR